ncbi:MAG TPA: nucleoid-associated protein [Cellvibrionaceae bacterium]
MPFSQFIAHRIERQNPQALVNLTLRRETLELNGKSEELAREIKKSYIKKTGKSYGRFSSDVASHPLSQWLREYREGKLSFTSFTHSAMTHLKLEIEKCESLVYSHMLIAEEVLEGAEFVYFILLDHQTAWYLDSELQISDSLLLDPAQFSTGARINLREWEGQENNNYISIVKYRNDKDLSEAFINFIGFTDKIDQKAQTAELIEAVEQYAERLDSQTASQTRHTLVNYCLEQAKQDKPVLIEELSQQIDHEKSAEISQFIQNTCQSLPKEIVPDPSALRNLVRLSGRNEVMSMSFASDCIGSTVVYDTDSDSLIIKSIPPALKTRLLKLLRQKN